MCTARLSTVSRSIPGPIVGGRGGVPTHPWTYPPPPRHTHPEHTIDTPPAPLPSMDRMTDKRLWKYYLPVTSLAGGNYVSQYITISDRYTNTGWYTTLRLTMRKCTNGSTLNQNKYLKRFFMISIIWCANCKHSNSFLFPETSVQCSLLLQSTLSLLRPPPPIIIFIIFNYVSKE